MKTSDLKPGREYARVRSSSSMFADRVRLLSTKKFLTPPTQAGWGSSGNAPLRVELETGSYEVRAREPRNRPGTHLVVLRLNEDGSEIEGQAPGLATPAQLSMSWIEWTAQRRKYDEADRQAKERTAQRAAERKQQVDRIKVLLETLGYPEILSDADAAFALRDGVARLSLEDFEKILTDAAEARA
jgi:hypothetical protein